MPKSNFTDDQHRQLGETIADIMTDYAKMADDAPAGFEVDEGSVEFYLGDSAGPIVGQWRVTVKRLGLD